MGETSLGQNFVASAFSEAGLPTFAVGGGSPRVGFAACSRQNELFHVHRSRPLSLSGISVLCNGGVRLVKFEEKNSAMTFIASLLC